MKVRKGMAIVLCLAMTFMLCPSIGKAEQTSVDRTDVKIFQDSFGEVSETGYIPINKTILNEKDLHVGKKKMSARRSVSIPAAYDAREDGLVNEIRDQGLLGNCWTYAAMSASESNIIKKGYEVQPDLSEYHLSYSAYNKALDPLGLTAGDIRQVKNMNNSVYSWGGNSYETIAALSRWQGIAEEEDAPVSDLFSACQKNITAIVPKDVLYKDSYHIKNAEYIYITEENRDLIKQKIMERGSGTISYYSGTDEENKRYSNTRDDRYTAYYCNDVSQTTNHMVAVIGWDDNYAVSNFNASCRPNNPGAWLIRNSWGEYNSMDGYFWLSYEDATINAENDSEAEITFYDVEPANQYDFNYQYDGGIPLSYVAGFASVANVFEAQHNEKIQAVSFYTQERNVKYEIDLYKTEDASNPMSGVKLGETITGQCEERGYHTIDFSEIGMEDVYVQEGDLFSVILSLRDSSGSASYYTIETISGLSGLEEAVSGGTNQSFIMSRGNWVDLTQVNFTNGKLDANFCLKAFTSEVAEVPTATPTSTQTTTPTSTPASTPTSTPTATPTSTPTATPTSKPTATPTSKPTATPTSKPTVTPTSTPTSTPTATPTSTPTSKPTVTPTSTTTVTPTATPTSKPTATPTSAPTKEPTLAPTKEPTEEPTFGPTEKPTDTPTDTPTEEPTEEPTFGPTEKPTLVPTEEPTDTPTDMPTSIPTDIPTEKPTFGPTEAPTSDVDSTQAPSETFEPTEQPVIRKLKFSPSSKRVKVGKKLKLSKYLKITKNRVGTSKLKYEFTKKKFKKYASLTKKGVLKAKKKGRKKTLYVRVRALDGSGKTAKIKIKIY